MSNEQRLALALAAAIATLEDMANGYPQDELHQPVEQTVAQGREALKAAGYDE